MINRIEYTQLNLNRTMSVVRGRITESKLTTINLLSGAVGGKVPKHKFLNINDVFVCFCCFHIFVVLFLFFFPFVLFFINLLATRCNILTSCCFDC